jgi:uncharacterized integral membrane protein
MTEEAQTSPAKGTRRRPKRSRAERVRLVGAFLLGALAVLFAVLNLEPVEVHWIVATWRTPLIVVILVCVLVGAAIGWVVARRRR